MYKALGIAQEAISKISSWHDKRKVLICLHILLGFDPSKPLLDE